MFLALHLIEYLAVGLIAFAAGFVDAAVGSGGLIQIPGLFAVFPAELPAMILGTNKFSSICGTTISMRRYARRVALRWNVLIPAFIAALLASCLGGEAARYLSRATLQPVNLALLVLVASYTFLNKSLGMAPSAANRRAACEVAGGAGRVGFRVLRWIFPGPVRAPS